MKLCADILYWRLKEELKAVELHGAGSPELTLSRPEFYLDWTQTFEKNRVYVCSADHLPTRPSLRENVCLVCLGQHWNLTAFYDRCSVIVVEADTDIFRVFNLVQHIFDRYEAWEERLWHILRHGANLPQMLEVSRDILSNPMQLIGSDFRYLAVTDEAYFQKDLGIRLDTETFDAEKMATFLSLHDLSTGEVTPLYASSVTGSKIVLYAQDGSLKVYDTDTGALLTDVNAGTIGDDQRVTLDCEEDGFVWMELRDADSYEIAAIRVYGPEGLVSDLSSLNETYNYLGYLTTDANGRPLYYGTRSVPGSSYATGCDVLDETGNVVMQGLGSCYSYYDNSLNALPDHVFVARRGFYYGWMDTDGNWLYCQSIFSSVNADDELGY